MWSVISLNKIAILILYVVFCKPHGNHKIKTHNRRKERNQGTPLWKIIKPQRKTTGKKERKNGTLKQPENN